MSVLLQARGVLEASQSCCHSRVVRCLARVPRRHMRVSRSVCGACRRGAVCSEVEGGSAIGRDVVGL